MSVNNQLIQTDKTYPQSICARVPVLRVTTGAIFKYASLQSWREETRRNPAIPHGKAKRKSREMFASTEPTTHQKYKTRDTCLHACQHISKHTTKILASYHSCSKASQAKKKKRRTNRRNESTSFHNEPISLTIFSQWGCSGNAADSRTHKIQPGHFHHPQTTSPPPR